jgi:hypothetical protein
MNGQSSIPVNETWLRSVVQELVDEEFFSVSGNIRRGSPILTRLAGI